LKGDYKILFKREIFGNSKILTLKRYRPVYCLAQGNITKVLSIPLHVVEIAIKNVSNTGENKEKTEFFN